jgi:hypothetical protein
VPACERFRLSNVTAFVGNYEAIGIEDQETRQIGRQRSKDQQPLLRQPRPNTER